MWFLPLFISCFLFFSPVMAAPVWIIDIAQIQFKGKESGKEFSGEFKKITPVVVFDPADLEKSSITVTIDAAAIVTGNSTYDSVLPTSEWFNVAKFPDVVFKSKTIRAIDKTHYQADGTLVMLGVSKDISLPFELTIDNGKAHAVGDVTLKRLDFGLGQSVDANGNTVSNDVVVHFNVTAHQ